LFITSRFNRWKRAFFARFNAVFKQESSNIINRLSPKEGLEMQGFPDDFMFPVSEVQAMKQLGNSVAVPAIQATAEQIIKALRKATK
jgi:site-specific DNA-cytosine methylase